MAKSAWDQWVSAVRFFSDPIEWVADKALDYLLPRKSRKRKTPTAYEQTAIIHYERDPSGVLVRGRQALENRSAIQSFHVDHGLVRRLKRAGKDSRAEELLLEAVSATEADVKADRSPLTSWYYYELAVMYRSQKRLEDEIQILRRFKSQCGSTPTSAGHRVLRRLAEIEKHFVD